MRAIVSCVSCGAKVGIDEGYWMPHQYVQRHAPHRTIHTHDDLCRSCAEESLPDAVKLHLWNGLTQ